MTHVRNTSPQAALVVSVIVPCLNEEYNLPAILRLLDGAAERVEPDIEVDLIVVDGASDDASVDVARSWPGVRVLSTDRGRAIQMNAGARVSRGDVLYFVHADTRPPLNCFELIREAVFAGSGLGGFAFDFDSTSRLLRLNSWLTGFNVTAFRGGDQSIYIRKELFGALGGFRESWTIMEEYDLLRRARLHGERYSLLPGRTLVSDRKYEGRSWAKVQVANINAMAMWRLGFAPEKIRSRYAALLH